MCERNWGDVKEIQSSKRSGLSSEFTEKFAFVYTTAWVKEAWLRMKAREERREDSVDFEDQYLASGQELKNVGVVVWGLKRPVRKRAFRCWLSKEENEWWKKRDPVNEARLLKKFGGVELL